MSANNPVWTEVHRYIPYQDQDFDVEYVHPESEASQDFAFPAPHIGFKDQDGNEKIEEIPQEDYDRLVEQLKSGVLTPELLSQLPLSELIPSMAQHQGRLSGASRLLVPSPVTDDSNLLKDSGKVTNVVEDKGTSTATGGDEE